MNYKNEAKFKPLYILFYIVIFYTMISQGGYFKIPMIVLNIFFMLLIIINKKTLTFDSDAWLLTALSVFTFLSGVFISITPYTAFGEFLKYTLYPLSYLVFINLGELKKIETIFFRSIVMLMIFGILGFIGIPLFPNLVNESTNRMHSFLQYANTTAMFMGIGIFYCTNRLIHDKKIMCIPLGILFLTALILTKSRTGFVIFTVVYIMYILKFLSRKKRWILALSIMAVCAALVIFDNRIIRISLFEPTLVERYITYLDAVKYTLSNPEGMGLGNWKFMQFGIQSAPYQVSQIHNVYLQIALDGGIISLIVWLAVVVNKLLGRNRDMYFYLALFIAASSFFEVHFSFGIVIIFSTFVLANIQSAFNGKHNIRLNLKFNTRVRNSLAFIKHFKLRYALVVPVVILVIALISECAVGRGDYLRRIGRSEDARRAYNTGLNTNPVNYEIYFKLAQLEQNPNEAFTLLEKSLYVNKLDVDTLTALAEGYLYKKDFEKAYYYAGEIINIHAYSMKNQGLAKKILDESCDKELISEERYQALYEELELKIKEKNDSINPLYRYIDSNMLYKR